MRAYFCHKMVHYGIFVWCIVGFMRIVTIQMNHELMVNWTNYSNIWCHCNISAHWPEHNTHKSPTDRSIQCSHCRPVNRHRNIDLYDDVMTWNRFSHNWPFVTISHQCHQRANNAEFFLLLLLLLAWTSYWINSRSVSILRRHDVTVMGSSFLNGQTVVECHIPESRVSIRFCSPLEAYSLPHAS